MQIEAIVGGVIVLAALLVMTALTLWSRRRIDHLARHGYPSVRQDRSGPGQ